MIFYEEWAMHEDFDSPNIWLEQLENSVWFCPLLGPLYLAHCNILISQTSLSIVGTSFLHCQASLNRLIWNAWGSVHDGWRHLEPFRWTNWLLSCQVSCIRISRHYCVTSWEPITCCWVISNFCHTIMHQQYLCTCCFHIFMHHKLQCGQIYLCLAFSNSVYCVWGVS